MLEVLWQTRVNQTKGGARHHEPHVRFQCPLSAGERGRARASAARTSSIVPDQWHNKSALNSCMDSWISKRKRVKKPGETVAVPTPCAGLQRLTGLENRLLSISVPASNPIYVPSRVFQKVAYSQVRRTLLSPGSRRETAATKSGLFFLLGTTTAVRVVIGEI